ncbi:hypothetical protein ACOMHN_025504 [Nucella lapillus]
MECAALGGHLASLNTPREWDAVFRVLHSRPHPTDVYLGLRYVGSTLPFYYKQSWQWADDSIAYFLKAEGTTGLKCGRFSIQYAAGKIDIYNDCSKPSPISYLCEMQDGEESIDHSNQIKLNSSATTFPVETVRCPLGHFTHTFSACDAESACWLSRSGFIESEALGVPTVSSCPAPLTSLPPMWACRRGGQRVAYSLVCDHDRQCGDGSDEDFCLYSPCSVSAPFQCDMTSQCISFQAYCDGFSQCSDNSDESRCSLANSFIDPDTSRLPIIVCVRVRMTFWPLGTDCSNPYGDPQVPECPDTHFECAGSGFCLPVFVRCNQVLDCPGREDEDGCEAATCVGYYRCRGSRVCVHSTHVCDGIFQCPQRDDEATCSVRCPASCTCHGLAFTCSRVFPASSVPDLRYLNAERSSMTPDLLVNNTLLIHLSLKECGLQFLHDLTLANLRSLDLSHNLITVLNVSQLKGVGNLQVLILGNNPLISLFPAEVEWSQTQTLTRLSRIDISRTTLVHTDLSLLAVFPNLLTVNFSHSTLNKLFQSGSQSATKLQALDFRGCPLTEVQPGIIPKLSDLQSVFADDYKMCCPTNLPSGFNVRKCVSPSDAVSSCEALLVSTVLRVSVGVSCAAGLLGNLFTLSLLLLRHRTGSCATDAFLTHLKLSDLAMCVSVCVLAVADAVLDGRYVSEDRGWRRGVVCSVLHFSSVACSQAAVCFTALLVYQGTACAARAARSLVFTPWSAHVMCLSVWLGCGAMSLVVTVLSPTPSPHHHPFSALCVRLSLTPTPSTPVTTTHTLLVLNLLLLFLSAVGMVVVYVSTLHTLPLPPVSFTPTTPHTGDRGGEWRQVCAVCVVSVLTCCLPCAHALLTHHTSLTSPGMTSWVVAAVVVGGPGLSAVRPWLHVLGERDEGRRRERRRRLLAYCRSKVQRHTTRQGSAP